jgi:hypothetical protein
VSASAPDHGGGGAMTRTRKTVVIILLAFVIYTIYNNPNGAAAYVRDAFVLLAGAIQKIFQFFAALLQ